MHLIEHMLKIKQREQCDEKTAWDILRKEYWAKEKKKENKLKRKLQRRRAAYRREEIISPKKQKDLEKNVYWLRLPKWKKSYTIQYGYNTIK